MATQHAVTVVNGRKFDRHPHWDHRNENYLVRDSALAQKTTSVPTHKSHTRCTWLDQGKEGGCVGYSEATSLSYAPKSIPKMPASFAEYCYYEAKQYDDMPGDDYEGSSVLGGQIAGVKNGYLESYTWAKSVGDICLALTEAPVNFGINWYNNMFNVSDEGIITISPGDTIAGGHAIVGDAFKTTKAGIILVRLAQTWGKSWGENGSAWIADTDIERLLAEDGECAVPKKAAKLPNPLGSHARVDLGT